MVGPGGIGISNFNFLGSASVSDSNMRVSTARVVADEAAAVVLDSSIVLLEETPQHYLNKNRNISYNTIIDTEIK